MQGKASETVGDAAKPVRLGVDARGLCLKRTGVERVLFHFLENLPLVGFADEVFLFTDSPFEEESLLRMPFRVILVPLRMRPLQKVFDCWLSLQLRPLLKAHDITVFFSPHTKFPFSRLPRYTTIHGLEWYYHPSGYTLVEKIKQWVWFQAATKASAGIVTFCENTRQDIDRICRGNRPPVCVVPEGFGSHFRVLGRRERSQEALGRYGIRPPFVLSVCSLDPRKNLDRLIDSFAAAVRETAIPHQLVLVGKSGRMERRLRRLAEGSGVAGRIVFTGYVSDGDLVQLYNQAELFVYPSLYEGFGLPVIEAMACGLPVITSNGSSLREVAQDAAILVDPVSSSQLKDQIVRCLTDDACRSALSTAGLQRACHFSWLEMTTGICKLMGKGGMG